MNLFLLHYNSCCYIPNPSRLTLWSSLWPFAERVGHMKQRHAEPHGRRSKTRRIKNKKNVSISTRLISWPKFIKIMLAFPGQQYTFKPLYEEYFGYTKGRPSTWRIFQEWRHEESHLHVWPTVPIDHSCSIKD